MIAACIAPSSERTAAAKGQFNLGRLKNVRRELRSPLLGPDRLGRLLGMSRSALCRLIESQGGVARCIRRQRLLESRAALCDPACDTSIAATADEFCFTDGADFSRAFRRGFGASDSDVRRRKGFEVQRLHPSPLRAERRSFPLDEPKSHSSSSDSLGPGSAPGMT